MRDILTKGLSARLGSLLGITFLLISLPLYESYESRPLFGRWSYAFGAFALVVGIAWAGLAIRSLRARRRPRAGGSTRELAIRAMELAVLCWGLAYLISALHDNESAGRLLDLNLVGSTHPAAVFLDWLAIALLLGAALLRASGLFRSRMGGLVLSVATTLVLLVILEGMARGKAVLFPAPLGFPTYSGEIWNDRYVRLNGDGFRDSEHRVAPVQGTRRLLVVGDSYTFGVGVKDPADRFGEQLGRLLEQHTGHPWEVINAGRSDSHTLQHIGFLEEMLRYQPDVVILLYVFNDIDYLHSLTQRNLLSEGASGIFQRIHPLLLSHLNSYAFQEAFIRFRTLTPGGLADDPYADRNLLGRHLTDVRRFVEIAERAGAQAAVVPFDIGVISQPLLSDRYTAFIDAAARAGVPVWPVAEAFEGVDYRSLYVNRFDRHPNARANRIAAEHVAEQATSSLGRMSISD